MSKMLDKAIKLCDSICKYTVKIESMSEAIDYCVENNIQEYNIFLLGSIYAIKV